MRRRHPLLKADIGEQRPAPPIQAAYPAPPVCRKSDGISERRDQEGFFSSLLILAF